MTENQDSPSRLSARQQKFLAALLEGETIAAAARMTNIPDNTARRWVTTPDFAQAYRNARKELLDATLSGILQDVSTARATLRAIMTNEDATDSARVRAAQIILETSIQLCKVDEMEARLQQLEELAKVKP